MSTVVELGNPATAEDVLRFLQSDIDSRAEFVRGAVALEYAVQLQFDGAPVISLRIKVWHGNEAAEPFNWITSFIAKTPTDQQLTPKSNTYGKDILDALSNALHSVAMPIKTAIDAGHPFEQRWLTPNQRYFDTPAPVQANR